MQFDVEGLQPGCEGSSALFLRMWSGNWVLIAQYCLPSLFILCAAHAICFLLVSRQRSSHTASIRLVVAGKLDVHHLDKPASSRLLRSAKQWTRHRLEVAFFTLVDLVYLNVCTISLKSFICVSTDVSYLLFAERSQLCWSHDHLPVAMFSCLVYPLLLFYPLFVYWQGRAHLEVRKRDGVTDDSTMAGSLSGGSLKDEYQPLGRAYAAGFRHVIALFLSAPLEPVQLRLLLPIFPLLFSGFVIKKRPFKKLRMNACKHP